MKVYLTGSFEATAENGVKVKRKRHGVVDVLARELLAAGECPSKLLEVFRGDTKVFEDRTIGEWASRRLLENDKTGFQYRFPHQSVGRCLWLGASE